MALRKYDSTVARIAGNLLSGVSLFNNEDTPEQGDAYEAALIRFAVQRARAIVAEVERTEPAGHTYVS